MDRHIYWTRSIDDWARDCQIFGDDIDAVIHLPCIRTQGIQSPIFPTVQENERLILVFGSVKAVQYAFEHQAIAQMASRAERFVAVGEKTALALANLGFKADFNPLWRGMAAVGEYLTDILGEDHIVVCPGPRGRAFDIDELLTDQGISCQRIDVYETSIGLRGHDDRPLIQAEVDAIIQSANGVICFASPSAVRGFVDWINPQEFGLELRLAALCIGDSTYRVAQNFFPHCSVSPHQSVESLFTTANDLLKLIPLIVHSE